MVEDKHLNLFNTWEETSYRFEQRQANPECVKEEYELYGSRKGPTYRLTFDPAKVPTPTKTLTSRKYFFLVEDCNSRSTVFLSLRMSMYVDKLARVLYAVALKSKAMYNCIVLKDTAS